MSEGSEPSARSAPADMRPSALRVRPTDGAAGLRDREPSLEVPERRARSMYERIAEYIEDVQTIGRSVKQREEGWTKVGGG